MFLIPSLPEDLNEFHPVIYFQAILILAYDRDESSTTLNKSLSIIIVSKNAAESRPRLCA